MKKGSISQGESLEHRDRESGRRIRQITSHPSTHHHPFFYIPAFCANGEWLVFVSHRLGFPALFVEERGTGRLIQLTERDDFNEWSIHPSYDGRYIYYTASGSGWRVGVDSFEEERLVDFGQREFIPKGMVADAMGTTSLSRNDRWWCVPVKTGETAKMFIVDTSNGEYSIACEAPTIGHPQFHPQDDTLIHYGGSYRERLWMVHRDGSHHELVKSRDADRKQWLVHEVWHPRRRELIVVDWPHRLFAIDLASREERLLHAGNAWHACPSWDGDKIVFDTVFPDRGLFVLNLEENGATPEFLCASQSSNEGAHWNTDHCPYDDGPITVYAPQHTHPHPTFSPDGSSVIFTSDRTGQAQLYEVTR
jgi:oligogalacturonide lyase